MRVNLRKFCCFSFLTLAIIILASFFLFSAPLSSQETQVSLPALAVHPLPTPLEQWQDSENQGDYFSSLESSPVGALIWSEFPVKIYADYPSNPEATDASTKRFMQWVQAVEQAIQEWKIYFPILEVQQRESADIILERLSPPLGSTFNPQTGKLEIPRARTAQTRYNFYFKATHPPILSHQMTIQISPSLSESSILSATRHELGHALGIWGHSPLETDALYFSQVRQPPSLSVRDINTLKKVYQQPTRLGWPVVRTE